MEKEIKQRLDRIEQYIQVRDKNILTVEDVCVLTGLSKDRIYFLCSNRRIPHYKQGKTYFLREEVEKWLLSNRIATKEESELSESGVMIKK